MERGAAIALTLGALIVVGCDEDGGRPPADFPVLAPTGGLTGCRDLARADEVCIAGGEFVMGHTPASDDPLSCGNTECFRQTRADGYVIATPAHFVRLSPFFIDRFPVTIAAYRSCMQRGECPPDTTTVPTNAPFSDLESEYLLSDPNLDEYPIATLTTSGAAANYCRSVGKRLPTEAEWERAARGPEANEYPWGNDPPSCARVPCGTAGDPALWRLPAAGNASPQRWHYPVGGNPADISPEGVREMVTGVSEFVDGFNSSYAEALGPLVDPAAIERNGGSSMARGAQDVSPVTYRGWSYALPAWWRAQPRIAGMRCARSDGPAVAGTDPTAVADRCDASNCFVAPQVGPRALAVAGDDILWLNSRWDSASPVDGQLMRASASAPVATPAMLAPLPGGPDLAMATDGAGVYVGPTTGQGQITMISLSSGAQTPVVELGCGVAAEPGAAYAGGGALRRISGTTAEVLVSFAAGEWGCVVAVTATDLHYCWTDGQGSASALRSVPKLGGAPTPLLDSCPTRVAFDDDAVYWVVVGATRTIMRKPFGAAAASEIAKSSVPVRALAATAGTVYWGEDTGEKAGGTIKKLSPTDAQPVVLATGQRGPRAFAFTATHVYWANAGTPAWAGQVGVSASLVGDGSIGRLPR